MARTGGFLSRHGNITLYIPNLIGYARIACTLGAFAAGRSQPVICLILYLISFVCDELDGRAARAFNQSSTFGAVLDMLTDRLSTAGLLILLCLEYPEWYMVFLSLISLDIFSHWLQMYSSIVAGDLSHKQTHNQSWLVRQYYTHRIFMGFCCVCCEVLYLALYMISWRERRVDFYWRTSLPQSLAGTKGDTHSQWHSIYAYIAYGVLPGFLIKQFVNIAQIRAAASALMQLDLERDRRQAKAS